MQGEYSGIESFVLESLSRAVVLNLSCTWTSLEEIKNQSNKTNKKLPNTPKHHGRVPLEAIQI